MMGLGYLGTGVGGIGNSSSSSSNLSALAPPFTVERSNPKLNSIPILHFSDSSYASAPDSQTWQYPNPSAPVPEVNFNSTVIDSLAFTYSSPGPISPPSTNWSALSPNAKTSADVFSYAGEVKPYYSHYVSPTVGKDSTSGVDHGPFYDPRSTSGPDLSPQVDYVQSLSGLEYAPRWDDAWAFDDGKQAKRVEHSGSFSYKKANVGDSFASKSYISPGVNGIEYGNNRREDFGISYGKLNHASAREGGIGSSTVGRMDEKSGLEQNLSFFPHASSRMPLSHSAYPESCLLNLSLEGSHNFSDYQKLNSPHEKCLQPLESSFSGSMSVTRSSPAVVIRPPPVNKGLLSQKAARKTGDGYSMSGTNKADLGDSNGAKQNDTFLRPIEGTSDMGQFTSHKKGSDSIFFANPLAEELSSQVPSKEILDKKMKAQCGSHLPDLNVSSGSSSAVNGVQVAVSTENSSECVDNYATSVDSPCWKGAPVSHFSPFDDVELGKSPSSKKSKECYDFDHEAHQLFLSLNDSRRASSQKPFEGKKHDDNRFAGNIMPQSSESSGDANHPTIAQSSTDALKAGFEISSTNSSKGVRISNPLDMHISNDKHSCAEMNDIPYMELSAANCTVTFNDASEGGAVAFHAAENVLCSPCSPKDASEDATVEPNPSLDVQAMVNAIHALSEVLVTNCTDDSFSLEDNDCFALKHVIRNLQACIDKRIVHQPSNKGPTISRGDILGKIVDAHNMATIADKPQVTNEALNSHLKHDNQQLHEEKRGDVFPGKQAESSSLLLSSLRGDEDISAADGMTQAIKKVLDENFVYDEEMDSQALLFKNLWLEAEAKLCSISYKARFDRMKTEMEKFKAIKEEGNSAVVEKMLKFQISSSRSTDANQPPEGQDSAIPKTVMNRFRILKSRDDSGSSENAGGGGEEEKTQETVNHDVEASIMDRFRILKSRNENSKLMNEEDEKQPSTDEPFGQTEGENLNVRPYFPEKSGGHESVKEFHLSVANDPVVHSLTNDMLRNQFSSGWYDNSSSDWEHVLKDDFAWKN